MDDFNKMLKKMLSLLIFVAKFWAKKDAELSRDESVPGISDYLAFQRCRT